MTKNLKVQYNTVLINFFLSYVFYFKFLIQHWNGDQIVINILSTIFTCILLVGSLIAFLQANVREKIIFLVIVAIVIVNLITSNNRQVFWLLTAFTFLVLFSRINVKLTVSILLASFLFALICYFPFQLFFSESFVFEDARYLRYTFGFINPNGFAMCLLLFQSLIYFWVINNNTLRHNAKIFFIIVGGLLITSLILLSKSRTYLLLSLLLSIMTLIYIVKYYSFSKTIIVISLLSVFAFQWCSTIKFEDYAIFQYINSFLSGRVWLSHHMYNEIGYPDLLFGKDIEVFQPIDFFFIAFNYTNGFILASILILYCLALFCTSTEFKGYVTILAFVFVLVSLTEGVFNIPLINYVFLLLYKHRNSW